MSEIRVPVLGESIVEATVSKWLKREGEHVAVGEPIVELETDKVNLEVAAEVAGVLTSIASAEGATVKIGDLLGQIDGAQVGESPASSPPAQDAAPPQPAAVAVQEPARAGADELLATPVALRMAAENHIDIRRVPASGPGGRVTKEDIVSYLEQREPAAPAPAPAPAPARQPTPAPTPPPAPLAIPQTQAAFVGEERREERIRMTRRRQTIARRLVEAQQTAAMLTTFNEVDMSAVMALRARRKEQFKERHGVGLGFMSFFTRAVVGALKSFPMLNAEIQGDEIVVKYYYDIGIAVGTEQGLVVPVVRNADHKTFAQIEREIVELAGRARANALTLAELQGGTFSITNGGIYGSLLSTPILNTPQVGILGMHKIEERPVVVAGQVMIRPMMYLALSYDHRIVDGSVAVSCLVRIKELLEDPEALLLEG